MENQLLEVTFINSVYGSAFLLEAYVLILKSVSLYGEKTSRQSEGLA